MLANLKAFNTLLTDMSEEQLQKLHQHHLFYLAETLLLY